VAEGQKIDKDDIFSRCKEKEENFSLFHTGEMTHDKEDK
jgi:hypothetical protein